eukprot:UN25588
MPSLGGSTNNGAAIQSALDMSPDAIIIEVLHDPETITVSVPADMVDPEMTDIDDIDETQETGCLVQSRVGGSCEDRLDTVIRFNNTGEYEKNLFRIQEAMQTPAEKCVYDGWYENQGDRFVALDWMPNGGTLYFDGEKWVIDADLGVQEEMGGMEESH